MALVRLEMDVAGAYLYGLGDQRIYDLYDRRQARDLDKFIYFLPRAACRPDRDIVETF